MTNEQLATEVREHQAARWRPAMLREHAKDHANDVSEILGRPLPPSELHELSRTVLHIWDRLFTELDRRVMASYISDGSLTNHGDRSGCCNAPTENQASYPRTLHCGLAETASGSCGGDEPCQEPWTLRCAFMPPWLASSRVTRMSLR